MQYCPLFNLASCIFFHLDRRPLRRLPVISSFRVADLIPLVDLRGWKVQVDELVPTVVQVGDSVPDRVVSSFVCEVPELAL